MVSFLSQLLVSGVFVLFGVSVAAFGMVRLVPGDPASLLRR